MESLSLFLSLPLSLRLNNFFRLEEHSHPSPAKSPLLGDVSAWEARNILLCDARACVTRAVRCEIISCRPLSVSLNGAFINFTAASLKNNIVERERNTDSRSLNRCSLIFHSCESPRFASLRSFSSPRYIGEGVIANSLSFRRCVFCVSKSCDRSTIISREVSRRRDLFADLNLCLELIFHIYERDDPSTIFLRVEHWRTLFLSFYGHTTDTVSVHETASLNSYYCLPLVTIYRTRKSNIFT